MLSEPAEGTAGHCPWLPLRKTASREDWSPGGWHLTDTLREVTALSRVLEGGCFPSNWPFTKAVPGTWSGGLPVRLGKRGHACACTSTCA